MSETEIPLFTNKTQAECYNARVSFPCNDCCCEYFELCNNKMELIII